MFEFYERRTEPLLPARKFYSRLARSVGWGLALISVSLAVGVAGYHAFCHLGWTDAFVNAAMILSGMGPIAELPTRSAKIFAGCYAIYSGIALISTTAVIFAPIVHRLMHRFHLEGANRD
ncbi:MAG TPA: hypothetical protein VHE61_13900 [Opitutaceae bacterium]|nr:hypothetical protein [Opitutaceae bacterium]